MAYPPQQGPYGPPPKKDRAPLIASMIFVVALLAGLGITGFVAPGFFLGDDDGGRSGASSSASGESNDTSSKGAAPGGLPGSGPDSGPDSGPEDGPDDPISAGDDDRGDRGDSDSESGGESGGGSGGDRPGAGGGAADGEAFAEVFVTALNDLDSTTANSMYCPDAVGGMADYVIKKNPELAIEKTQSSKYYLKVTLTGTLGGEPLNSGKISVELEGGNAPCVFTFTAG